MGYRNGNSTYYKSTVKEALEKYRPQTIYLIIGLMIGSIYAIIIGVTTLKVPQAPLSFSTFSIVYFIIGGLVILGMEVCRRLRAKKNTPIIMLTAKGDITDKVKGLDVGADDYLTKPFSVEELLARLRVMQRRIALLQVDNNVNKSSIYTNGKLKIDYVAGCAYKDDEELKLTPIEYKLLCILAKNTGKVLTHKYITQKIWGSAWDSNVASLRVFMATLRKKLGNDSNSYIQTHVGIGYRMLKVETNIEDEMLP